VAPDPALADVISGAIPAREWPDETLVFNLLAPYAWDPPLLSWACNWARQEAAGTEIRLTSDRPGYFPGW